MRWTYGIAGLALVAAGGWNFAQQGMSAFLSGWGVILFTLGLSFVLGLGSATWILNVLILVGVFVTGIVRLFLGMEDWWHWLFLSLGVFIVTLMTIATHTDESERAPDGESSASGPVSSLESSSALGMGAASEGSSQFHIPSAKELMTGFTPGRGRRSSVTSMASCAGCSAPVTPRTKFCGSCGAAV